MSLFGPSPVVDAYQQSPADRAPWIARGVVALWVMLTAVLVHTWSEHDRYARQRALEFQTSVGGHAPGAQMDDLRERAFQPGMAESAGPADFLLLPGGFGIGGHGALDAFPYIERLEVAPFAPAAP